MKKLMFFLLGILSIALAQAQTAFEGTVKWTLKMEVTDPQLKMQMEEANKQLANKAKEPQNSPNKKQIEDLKMQLNNPELKAMFDANPTLKAQIEQQIKMLEGANIGTPGTPATPPANPFMDFMPTGATIKMKAGNTLTRIEGSANSPLVNDILYLKDKKETYVIKRNQKTYFIKPRPDSTKPLPKEGQVKVTKTTETAKILNYTCTKYVVEKITSRGEKISQNIWATTEIKDVDSRQFSELKAGRGQESLVYEEIKGVPLKMELIDPRSIMIMEVTEIKKETISPAEFVIPADFKEVIPVKDFR